MANSYMHMHVLDLDLVLVHTGDRCPGFRHNVSSYSYYMCVRETVV
jgi:hypothetical protein